MPGAGGHIGRISRKRYADMEACGVECRVLMGGHIGRISGKRYADMEACGVECWVLSLILQGYVLKNTII